MTFSGLVDGGPLDGCPYPLGSDTDRLIARVMADGAVVWGPDIPGKVELKLGGVAETVVYRWLWGIWIPEA